MLTRDQFLIKCTLLREEKVSWNGETFLLFLAAYLSSVLPPEQYVTSVRCLIFKDDQVLVQRDRHTLHLLPGGRRECGETIEQTLHREVGEETGWAIVDAKVLGVLPVHHLGVKPAGYSYSYPDFLQVVYQAEASSARPECRLADGHEVDSQFLPITAAQRLITYRGGLVFLDAARRNRAFAT